jgi:hypothetical protein
MLRLGKGHETAELENPAAAYDESLLPELVEAADILAAKVNEAVLECTIDARSGPADAALAYAEGRFGNEQAVFKLKAYVESLQR